MLQVLWKYAGSCRHSESDWTETRSATEKPEYWMHIPLLSFPPMERLLSHISCYGLDCGSSRTSESFLVVVGFHGTPGIFPSVFHGRWDRNKFHGQFPQNLEHWRNASTFFLPKEMLEVGVFPPTCSILNVAEGLCQVNAMNFLTDCDLSGFMLTLGPGASSVFWVSHRRNLFLLLLSYISLGWKKVWDFLFCHFADVQDRYFALIRLIQP